MKLKVNKIMRKERNVFLGFLTVTIIFVLITEIDNWKYGLYLYCAHVVTMATYYAYKASKK